MVQPMLLSQEDSLMRRVPPLRTSVLAACPAVLVLAVVWAVAAQQGPATGQPDAGQKPAAPKYVLSGPFTHQNLTVFLIHGPDRLKSKKFLMLAEALEKKDFVIYET